RAARGGARARATWRRSWRAVGADPLHEAVDHVRREIELRHLPLAVSDRRGELLVCPLRLPVGAREIRGADHRPGGPVAFARRAVALRALRFPGRVDELRRVARPAPGAAARRRPRLTLLLLALLHARVLFGVVVVRRCPLLDGVSRRRPLASGDREE